MQVQLNLPAHTDHEAGASLRELMNSKFTPLAIHRLGGMLIVTAHLPDDSAIPWTLRLSILAAAVGAPITGQVGGTHAIARPGTTRVDTYTERSPQAA